MLTSPPRSQGEIYYKILQNNKFHVAIFQPIQLALQLLATVILFHLETANRMLDLIFSG